MNTHPVITLVGAAFGGFASLGCGEAHAPVASMAETPAMAMQPANGIGASAGEAVGARTAEEMLDVRASIAIVVAEVEDRAKQVREQVRTLGGRVVVDRSVDRYGQSGAAFTLRLPPASLEPFLAQLGGLGSVRRREIVASDVSAEYRDLEVQLANLEATLERLRALAQRAEKTSDLIEVERELNRVGVEIDRVKGRRAFLADRVAFATVELELIAAEAARTTTHVPKAFVHPGVGAGFVHDFRGSRGGDDYLGGGLTIAWSRGKSLEIEGYKRLERSGTGLDLVLVTAGGSAYSELFGDGKRDWLNPFVGLRAGYARRLDTNEFVTAGVAGIELWKGDFVTLEAQSRALLLLGGSEPAHVAITGGLAASGSF